MKNLKYGLLILLFITISSIAEDVKCQWEPERTFAFSYGYPPQNERIFEKCPVEEPEKLLNFHQYCFNYAKDIKVYSLSTASGYWCFNFLRALFRFRMALLLPSGYELQTAN